MSSARQRAALTALDAARTKAHRLDPSRNGEENAADIIDMWAATETALRSLLGGSALAGQPLIHEARQRHLIGLEQANRLAAFLSVRDRVQRTDYTPSTTDIGTARDAYRSLEDSLMAPPSSEPVAAAPVAAAEPVGTAPGTVRVARRRRIPLILVVGVLLLIAGLVALWYFMMGPGSYAAYERGVEHYQAGRPEAARGAFEEAARAHEDDPRPLIFLGRIAREERDMAAAQRHLADAIARDTSSALAMREMGSVLFAAGNYQLARNFYIRAVERDPDDRLALGYLGCTLVRLGNVQAAMTMFQRAGQGPWMQCVQMPQQMPVPPPR